MAEINPIKLQKPLKDKDGSFYPLTTYDQIVMPDNSRWNGVAVDERAVFVDRTGATAGVPTPVNADTLGGVPAEEYALKSDISSKLPTGGTVGQVLAKVSDKDNDVDWVDQSGSSEINWSNIQNKPTEFAPSEHNHAWDDITEKPDTYPPSEHTNDFESCGLKKKNGIIMHGS